MKRIIIILLALTITASLFTSCKKPGEGQAIPTGSSQAHETAASGEEASSNGQSAQDPVQSSDNSIEPETKLNWEYRDVPVASAIENIDFEVVRDESPYSVSRVVSPVTLTEDDIEAAFHGVPGFDDWVYGISVTEEGTTDFYEDYPAKTYSVSTVYTFRPADGSGACINIEVAYNPAHCNGIRMFSFQANAFPITEVTQTELRALLGAILDPELAEMLVYTECKESDEMYDSVRPLDYSSKFSLKEPDNGADIPVTSALGAPLLRLRRSITVSNNDTCIVSFQCGIGTSDYNKYNGYTGDYVPQINDCPYQPDDLFYGACGDFPGIMVSDGCLDKYFAADGQPANTRYTSRWSYWKTVDLDGCAHYDVSLYLYQDNDSFRDPAKYSSNISIKYSIYEDSTGKAVGCNFSLMGSPTSLIDSQKENSNNWYDKPEERSKAFDSLLESCKAQLLLVYNGNVDLSPATRKNAEPENDGKKESIIFNPDFDVFGIACTTYTTIWLEEDGAYWTGKWFINGEKKH